MKRIAIVDGHPDPSPARLNHALADRYARAALDAGHEVRRINVGQMEFPLLRDPAEFYEGQPPDAIRAAQQDIRWADHVAFFTPMWHGSIPSLFKGFIEQTFRPGFALEYGGGRRLPKALMKGKSARIVMTMGMPPFFYRAVFGAHGLKAFERSTLGFAGFAPIRETLIGNLPPAKSNGVSKRWIERMGSLAEEDTETPPPQRRSPLRALVRAAFLAGAAYAAYAGAAWLRFGNGRRRPVDTLLDRVMPEYDVRTRHCVGVRAPAAVTFDAIRDADFDRSPVVRTLLRTREMLLGAAHVERPLPHGVVHQAAALGWTIVAEEPGRELVLAAVTQPWLANPTFRGLPAEEFRSFAEPGYAKIVFTLRVDPQTSEHCSASTETRVQTTDALSRTRFRRYWALLLPGIELIRLILLQQVKGEAETRWTRSRETATV